MNNSEFWWHFRRIRRFWQGEKSKQHCTCHFFQHSLSILCTYVKEKQLNPSFNCELSNTCRPPTLREWVENISNHFHAILRPFGRVEKNAFLSDGVYCHKLGCNIILLKKYLGSSLRQRDFSRFRLNLGNYFDFLPSSQNKNGQNHCPQFFSEHFAILRWFFRGMQVIDKN